MTNMLEIMTIVDIGLFFIVATYALFRIRVMSSLVFMYLTGTDEEAKIAMGKLVMQSIKIMIAVIILCILYEIGVRCYGGEDVFLKLLK